MSRDRADYHHGNLRADALAAARSILVAEGEAKVALRRVAEAIGVTHTALARPFGGREGLMDALAADGLRALAEATENAPSAAAFVRAYLRFALAAPSRYDLAMRRARTAPDAAGQLIDAARAALDRDDEAIKAVWMTLHGGLALRAAGTLDTRDDDAFEAMMVRLTGAEG